jgi:hypothetical protein
MASFKKVNIFSLKAPAISLGQKWQRTQVGKKILAANEVRRACTLGSPKFYFWEGGSLNIKLSPIKHWVPPRMPPRFSFNTDLTSSVNAHH